MDHCGDHADDHTDNNRDTMLLHLQKRLAYIMCVCQWCRKVMKSGGGGGATFRYLITLSRGARYFWVFSCSETASGAI